MITIRMMIIIITTIMIILIIIVIKEATSPRHSSMGTYLQNHPANLQENINKGTLK